MMKYRPSKEKRSSVHALTMIASVSSKRSRFSICGTRRSSNSTGRLPRPTPDVETAAAQDIDERELLGQADRIVERQDGRGQADPDAPGAHGDDRRQHRRRDRQAVVDEVMLGEPTESKPSSSVHAICSISRWITSA